MRLSVRPSSLSLHRCKRPGHFEQFFMKISGTVNNGSRNRSLNIDDVPDSRGTLTPELAKIKGVLIIKQVIMLHNRVLLLPRYTIYCILDVVQKASLVNSLNNFSPSMSKHPQRLSGTKQD